MTVMRRHFIKQYSGYDVIKCIERFSFPSVLTKHNEQAAPENVRFVVSVVLTDRLHVVTLFCSCSPFMGRLTVWGHR